MLNTWTHVKYMELWKSWLCLSSGPTNPPPPDTVAVEQLGAVGIKDRGWSLKAKFNSEWTRKTHFLCCFGLTIL